LLTVEERLLPPHHKIKLFHSPSRNCESWLCEQIKLYGTLFAQELMLNKAIQIKKDLFLPLAFTLFM
jgi:hypothetical protein